VAEKIGEMFEALKRVCKNTGDSLAWANALRVLADIERKE
jgi:hypothetical protein